ncbi:hypothetical protein LWI29_016320 [Acer saccharum]|uniref:Uncharacterized protein n=1 Tax=Acer saccharum TaxID=4024 RepID=A0AA39VXK6_ACESA|nr:hypothetical protein LWI29_016320 [Acer saccharum]
MCSQGKNQPKPRAKSAHAMGKMCLKWFDGTIVNLSFEFNTSTVHFEAEVHSFSTHGLATLPLTIHRRYLSRLQRILPVARWELRFQGGRAALPPHGLHQRHVPMWDREVPTAGRQTGGGERTRRSSPDSDLEAFSVIIQRTVASRHWLFNQAR